MSTDKRRDLRDLLDELDRYFEEFERDLQESVRKSMDSAKTYTKPYMAGFSFHMGPEGKPSVQFFGDSASLGDGFRAPLTDQILDEKSGMLRLVLDMPGVEKDDIEVETSDEHVVVKATRENRRYKADIPLKAEVDSESGKAEYKNGVLEISFSLKDKNNKGYRRVDIV